jgi:hypothetical protein
MEARGRTSWWSKCLVRYHGTVLRATNGRSGGGDGAANADAGQPRSSSSSAFFALELGLGTLVMLGLSLALVLTSRVLRRTTGYSGLRASGGGGGGASVRVVFELSNGLREDGELSLSSPRSVKQLRLLLLQLADELLLDPEDDLGEWTLRYTDRGSGVLLPVTPSLSLEALREHAAELRVTAGSSLRHGGAGGGADGFT